MAEVTGTHPEDGEARVRTEPPPRSEQMGGEPPVENTGPDAPYITLLYILLRDHVSPGVMEGLVCQIETHPGGSSLTNRFLAGYAENLAGRLGKAA